MAALAQGIGTCGLGFGVPLIFPQSWTPSPLASGSCPVLGVSSLTPVIVFCLTLWCHPRHQWSESHIDSPQVLVCVFLAGRLGVT